MSVYLPNGLGESLGDTLVTNAPLFTTSTIWYVHSETGVDNPAYGDVESRPLATLAYTLTNKAGAGDIVVLLDGHEESIATKVDVANSVVIVGVGETDGKPTVKFTNGGAVGAIIELSANGVELRNIWFEEHPSGAAVAQVSVLGDGCRIIGCYFEADGNNEAASVDIDIGADFASIKNCTFISTTDDPTNLPTSGVAMVSTTLFLDNNVFDDGDCGYGTSAFVATAGAKVRGEGNSFLRGAQFSAASSSPDIILGGGQFSGGVRWIE